MREGYGWKGEGRDWAGSEEEGTVYQFTCLAGGATSQPIEIVVGEGHVGAFE